MNLRKGIRSYGAKGMGRKPLGGFQRGVMSSAMWLEGISDTAVWRKDTKRTKIEPEPGRQRRGPQSVQMTHDVTWNT